MGGIIVSLRRKIREMLGVDKKFFVPRLMGKEILCKMAEMRSVLGVEGKNV